MIENSIKYIAKVAISGLWDRYDIVWNLHPDVNVLAGINGSGKSTILNCIFDLALDNKAGQYVNYINRAKIIFNNNDYIIYKPPITCLHSDSQKKGFFGNFKQVLPHVNILSTFDSELKPLEAVQKLSDERVKTELDWELSQLQVKYLEYKLDLGRKQTTLMESNYENVKAEFEKIRYTNVRFLEIIDELFSETHKKNNPAKNQLEFLLDDKEINAYQLSSGEKQLLIILLTVLVQDNKPAILLMDEPEISLHIEWQRKLIKYIRELNPNVQLIIATHSPDIIIKGWLDKVVNIEDMIVKDNAVA